MSTRPSPPAPGPRSTPRSGAEGGAPEDYLRLHAARALEAMRRRGNDLTVEVVHDSRTSLRRLRATVRTLPALVADPTAVDAALQEVALVLGAVRDVDVLSELLLPAADELTPDPAAAPLRALLEHELAARRAAALAALAPAAEAPRWQEAATLLQDWSRTPPSLPRLDVAQALGEAEALTRRRLRAAGADPAALHSARKAAKRWRYAAELLAAEPAAAHHRERAEAVQEELGLIQDLEIALGLLDELEEEGAGVGAAHAAPAAVTSAPEALGGLAVLRAALAARQRDLVNEVAARTHRPLPEPSRGRVATRGSAAPPAHGGCPAPDR